MKKCKITVLKKTFDGELRKLENIKNSITTQIRGEVQVKPQVELLPPGSLPVSEGKTKRVIDKRNI